MTEAERITRLTTVLAGTGATVNDAFGIWALYSDFSDAHIAAITDWADLQFLVADSTRITDASVALIMCFLRLKHLSISGNKITSAALAACTLPIHISTLGLGGIRLEDDAVSTVLRCTEITSLNVNYCHLSSDALAELATLPKLKIVEALGNGSELETGRVLSERHPAVLFRLRDGLWRQGKCLRPPLPNEVA